MCIFSIKKGFNYDLFIKERLSHKKRLIDFRSICIHIVMLQHSIFRIFSWKAGRPKPDHFNAEFTEYLEENIEDLLVYIKPFIINHCKNWLTQA